jgi:tetratricopeptide (TPR) repeat protein
MGPTEFKRFGSVSLWASRGEEHWRVAEALHGSNPAFTGSIAFHAEKAIEKFLIAFLLQNVTVVPPSYQLAKLIRLTSEANRMLGAALADCPGLDELVDEYESPTTARHVTASQARSSVDWARKAHDIILPLLQFNTLNPSPLQLAQELVYEAWDDDDPEEQRKRCHEALRICSDCADAYVLLANHAQSNEEAMSIYKQGVEAGERSIAPLALDPNQGDFWAIEARPYMRARCGLARCLWLAGDYAAAAEECREMLRLNPNDNQGMRYLLVGCLLHLGRDDETAEVLDSYQTDDSASWAYWRALLALRKQGDARRSRGLLKLAIRKNRRIAGFLCSARECPPLEHDYITPGGEDEAIEYAGHWAPVWRNTPGALDCLRRLTSTRSRVEDPDTQRGREP